MSWYFSVALPADPVGCQDAAATLRSVARAAADAGELLADQAVVPAEQFSGIAARSYRAACADLHRDSGSLARHAHELAAALERYAVRVSAVRRELTRIREVAVRQGFEVTADDLVMWVPAPGTELDETYRRLQVRASSVLAEAAAACAEWRRTLHDHTSASPEDFPTLSRGA